MVKKGKKFAPKEDAVAYLYETNSHQRKVKLFKASLFPLEDRTPDGAVLMDGTEVRLVPTNITKGIPLFISKNGQGYSYHNGQFRAIIPSKATGREISYYIFTHYETYVHTAVKSAWDGPRPEGYQCDHINGNTYDNRLENLEWVTREENARRRWLLKSQNGLGYRGKKLTDAGRGTLRSRKLTAKKYGLPVEIALGATLVSID